MINLNNNSQTIRYLLHATRPVCHRHGAITSERLRAQLALYLTTSAHGNFQSCLGALPGPYTCCGTSPISIVEQRHVLLPSVAFQHWRVKRRIGPSAERTMEAAFDAAAAGLQVAPIDCRQSGSTAVVCVRKDRSLYLAHVGDSRAVLGRCSCFGCLLA